MGPLRQTGQTFARFFPIWPILPDIWTTMDDFFSHDYWPTIMQDLWTILPDILWKKIFHFLAKIWLFWVQDFCKNLQDLFLWKCPKNCKVFWTIFARLIVQNLAIQICHFMNDFRKILPDFEQLFFYLFKHFLNNSINIIRNYTYSSLWCF
jgi:hypothetical protein